MKRIAFISIIILLIIIGTLSVIYLSKSNILKLSEIGKAKIIVNRNSETSLISDGNGLSTQVKSVRAKVEKWDVQKLELTVTTALKQEITFNIEFPKIIIFVRPAGLSGKLAEKQIMVGQKSPYLATAFCRGDEIEILVDNAGDPVAIDNHGDRMCEIMPEKYK